MGYLTGLSKHEITCFIPGLGMMGYGQPHNVVKEIATPLFARALIIKDQVGTLLVFIHLELAFATMALKESILNELQHLHPEWKITEDNLLLTAQHTHSAPGGYSHYPFYNFTIPGYRKQVVETVTQGSVKAVKAAFNLLSPSTINYGEVKISEDKEVAFNRSLGAHLNNPNVDKNLTKEEAVDRRMRGLIIKSEDGKIKGIVNWFGVHCTSISSYNQRIHHDNKGIAASLFESQHPGTVALFVQSAAGDISPNFVWDKKIKRMRGKFSDQYESAEFNGEIQFRESEKILGTEVISGNLKCLQSYFDMRTIATSPAHGVAFFKGTLEGPGLPSSLASILNTLCQAVKTKRIITDPRHHKDFYDQQHPKSVMLDHRDGSFIGITPGSVKKLPYLPDTTLDSYRLNARSNSLHTLPWVPAIIPYQLIRIGQILLVTIPGEITTMAAEMLEQQIKNETKSIGITQVLITSYANGYMGYITTPQEYDLQFYEGGHTVYGRNTMKAMMAAINGLILRLKGQTCPYPDFRPQIFPEDELTRRSF